MTAGTNTPETLSATFAIGAFVAAASLTIRMICESVVSSPTLVARHFTKPDWLIVAAETVLPASLSTGMLSPVRAASFTAQVPSVTTPSTGMLSPDLTTKISPISTSAIGTFISAPFRSTVAVFGARRIRPFSVSVVLPLDLASSIFPTEISTSIMAADSK